MPSKTTKIKASSVKSYSQVIGQGKFSWKPGVVSLVAEDRLPIGAVVQAQNMMQTQDGVWGTRWGSKNYGATYTGPVTGFQDFSYGGVNYYCVIDNGAFKYAHDGGAWTTVTGHTWNTTVWSNIVQYENKLLICNGIDAFAYIDLASFAYVPFVHVAAPTTSSATVTLGAGLSSSNPVTTLYYYVTAVTQVGETVSLPFTPVAVNIDRNNWYSAGVTLPATSTEYAQFSWTAPTGSIVGYNIYISDGVSGVAYYLDSTNQTSYTDYGYAAINDFIQVPVSDTTTAPSFSWVAISDNRLWACGDPNNPSRIYWAGTGPQYNTGFSPYVGGGWVDILPGAPQTPQYIGQFRDGKGDPMTTILMEEPSGYGSTWHCALSTDTIGNTVITVPTLIQSMGTFGTGAPRSVVQTNQNVYFHSAGPAGIYSTGSIATLFNVLSTNEITILVRPDLRAITQSASKGICSQEFDRKLFYSVPYGADQNNRIMVWDLEKENWNPYAFDFGVNAFVRYTDSDGVLHLLTIPTTPTAGNFIVELNSSFLDDNGTAFESHIQTGLIHVAPDHIQFAHITYVYYEFGSPSGRINLIFSGTPKNLPLSQLASYPIGLGSFLSDAGFSSYAFSTEPYSYALAAPSLSSSLSVKERVRINKLLNNWEADVSSTNVGTNWTLNQLVVIGQYVPTADPSSWIVN